MRRRSRHVQWGNSILPLSFVEPPIDLPPGTCGHCGGLGVVPETIDEERYDVMVPCFKCRVFCKACDKYVAKSGHECKGV